jgi:inorganic phosphate transporter, PiT family
MIVAIILILLICAFEFVNGFHDTANAVATVIYTETLKAKTAVIYSAAMNFLGILISTTIGYGVAYKIFHLMPWEHLTDSTSHIWIYMIVAILLSSLTWNITTRWFKIPSSSTHALIASIVGASLWLAQIQGWGLNPFTGELNHILLSLIISPLIGAVLWFGLYRLSKLLIHDKHIFHAPQHHHEEKRLSALLIFTCGFVSFSHGANDGQKWLGMIMIALVATGFATVGSDFHIPIWAIILIPSVLGTGTMVGWKRIVKTVGRKIWTHDMTYAQWACAEIVAATTIGAASLSGLPVSTTHVLSSAVMGTMVTDDLSSINRETMRHIWLAWVLTIPVCGLASFLIVELLSTF